MFLISDLCSILDQYLEKDQVAEIYQAYLFGAEAHEGQRRLSGEPYIYHPLAVARILSEMRLDHKTIIASLETLEETVKTHELKPPTLIIVGEVVKMKEKLDWFNPQAPQGQAVKSTKW